MTPPRRILPGQLCFVTWRAVARTFRFIPKRDVTHLIQYAFAVMAQRYDVRIHEVIALSNHFHLLCTDTKGRLPDFMRDLNSLIARGLNALRGTTGSAIEKQYNLVAVADDDRAIDHCVYTLANPCKADLVRRCRQWRGLNSVGLRYGIPVSVSRPAFALWSAPTKAKRERERGTDPRRAAHMGRRSRLPKSTQLVLVRPSVRPDLSDDALRELILARLDERERELIEERARAGRTVMGMKAVLKQRYWDSPRTFEPLFGTRPRVSARSRWARIETLARNAAFGVAYRAARRLFMAGERGVAWPEGTWLMRRLHGCPALGPP